METMNQTSIQVCRRLPSIILSMQNRLLDIYQTRCLQESSTKMAAYITICSLVLARLQLSDHVISWITSVNTQILDQYDQSLELYGTMSERTDTSYSNGATDPEWEMIQQINYNINELGTTHSTKLLLLHLRKTFLINCGNWLREITWFAMEILEPTPNGHTPPWFPNTPDHNIHLHPDTTEMIDYWRGNMQIWENSMGAGK